MPTTTLNDFAFFALVNSYLKQQIAAFQSGFVERMTQWALAISLVLVTLWLLIQGFRIVTGQSREPMMGLVVNGAKISLIVAAATTMGLFGNNLQTFFSENLAGEINYQVSGSNNSAADDIDKSLVYTQLAMAAIDVVQTAPGDTETSNKKARAELLAGLGVAGPPMVAGAMLLFYQFILAAFIGLGPLFILFLIFDQTKQLFHKWLLLGISTLFSMAMLNVVSAIVLKLTLSVASALWASNAINNMTVLGAEGLSNQALEQGGVGLLMTLLVVSIPPVLGNFFAGAAGSFLPYSQVGGSPKAAGDVGPQGQPPGLYAPPQANIIQASHGPRASGGDAFSNNPGRVVSNSNASISNTAAIPKRDFDPQGRSAYGACPEGQYPASLPGKPLVCKPIPVLHWGAIAADIPNGNAGTSAGLLNRQQAEQAAVADCKSKGVSQCTSQIAYGNGCAALVTNDSAFFSSADVTQAFATDAAMKKCAAAGGVCKLVLASCSTSP